MKSKNRGTLALIGLGVPLLLINVMAVTGQALYALNHIHPSLWVALPFAGAVESIAVFLAVMAHLVALAGDSALKLRLGAYAMGLVSGAMNYSHWAGENGVAAGLGFGLLSASSPWLWAIYTRYQARDALRASGQIEPRAVKFSAARWILWRRETWVALKVAVYAGITDPMLAVRTAAENYPDSAPFALESAERSPESVESSPETAEKPGELCAEPESSGDWASTLSGVGGRNGDFLRLLEAESGHVERARTRLAAETPHTVGSSLAYNLARQWRAQKERV